MNTLGNPIRTAFGQQATACRALGSPFTARVLDLLKDRLDPDSVAGAAILGWTGDPVADALALRVAGALNGLVLDDTALKLKAVYPPFKPDTEGLWSALSDTLDEHADRIVAWIGHPPQTNEVARSAMILPGLLMIARRTGLPLRLLEFGASGGLNLLCDRFRYHYGADSWGDPDGPVLLRPEVRGGTPPLDGDLRIEHRAGCDANPLDPRSAEHRLRLLAFTWPDQAERLARQKAALDMAATSDMSILRQDAADWVEARLGERHDGCCPVILHSVVWQYLPGDTRRRIEIAVQTAGARADRNSPLAWLRMEGSGGGDVPKLMLTLWPGEEILGETRALATCDWHGRWIDWKG